MKSVRPLCLATLAGLSVLTSCQGEATEESTATGVTETETADTTDPETTAGICNESDIPLGEGYPAPEADCPDTLSDTASDIQQGFVNTGLAGMALRAELLDPNNINVILWEPEPRSHRTEPKPAPLSLSLASSFSLTLAMAHPALRKGSTSRWQTSGHSSSLTFTRITLPA